MDTVRDRKAAGAASSGLNSQPPGGRLHNAERAYGEIKRRILDNEMPIGVQVLEQELAELLGMSRTPVREAMVRLADEGLVEIRPRHGMRILPVSAADMREIYQILIALEATAAELLAERGVDPGQLAQMTAAVADMDRAMAEDDLQSWAAADERFHRLLVDFCGNARLRTLVGTFWDQSHRARMATLNLRPTPIDSSRDHAAVVDAIARRDPAAARTIHREHRIRAGGILVAILEDSGLTQI